jgi:crossover junction endodeoxyribonuclease RusA
MSCTNSKDVLISLDLPYPPTVNHYWGVAGKRRFIGTRGREFRKAVLEASEGVQKVEGRISMWIELYPPDRRIRDIDNITKALLDACMHAGCYEDDSQIDELHIIRREVRKGGGCSVVITTL